MPSLFNNDGSHGSLVLEVQFQTFLHVLNFLPPMPHASYLFQDTSHIQCQNFSSIISTLPDRQTVHRS
jgi:hypothetical protein